MEITFKIPINFQRGVESLKINWKEKSYEKGAKL